MESGTAMDDLRTVMRELAEQSKETDRRLNELGRQIGGLGNRLGEFKRLFPQYRDTRLLGAVAAMVVPDDAARHAETRGLFVVGQAGDDAVFLNSEGFEPMAW